MALGFVIFLILATLIVVTGHWGIFVTVTRLFAIESSLWRALLAWWLGIMGFAFIPSALLVHWHETLLTRGIYLVTSVWLGCFIYLLMAMALAWIFYLATKGLGLPTSSTVRWLFALPFIAAFAFSGYSLWNAANPVVRQITVSIANLPESWQGRKVAHLSDIHIGAILREGFLNRVVAQTNAETPDIVLITGDPFDGAGIELGRLAEPLNQLEAPLDVYFITGNHETYVGLDRVVEALSGIKLRILRDEIVEIDGMQLIGIDYPVPGKPKLLDSLWQKLDLRRPSILMFHEPRLIDQAKAAGVSLQLVGHTHRGQMWPFNYVTKRVYGGYDYGLFIEEDYALYVSCGVGTWGPPLRSGNRPEIVIITLARK